jgi:hypothetical protein
LADKLHLEIWTKFLQKSPREMYISDNYGQNIGFDFTQKPFFNKHKVEPGFAVNYGRNGLYVCTYYVCK